MPAVHGWRDRDRRNVSLVVMLDDYDPMAQNTSLPHEQARETVLKYLRELEIEPDFVCWESHVAKQVDQLLPLIEPAPPRLSGVVGRNQAFREDDGTLTFEYKDGGNFDPNSDWARTSQVDETSRTPTADIGLFVRLALRDGGKWAGWSCPAAAAWWQLVRFGALSGGQAPGEGDDRDPTATLRLNGDAIFAAKRTLTLLPPGYLGVEHAVRKILECVRLPEALRSELGFSEDKEDSGELLRRMSYVFADPDF